MGLHMCVYIRRIIFYQRTFNISTSIYIINMCVYIPPLSGALFSINVLLLC